MFWNIFSFEIKYRLKRPATYIYFFIFFLFGFIAVASGSTPASEKVFHNAPWTLGTSNVTFSLFMMMVCSAIMGVPLYRDIEHRTRNYFFAYPISKAAYFWGRFLGSFLFVLIIGTAFNWGALLGSVTGPAFGWVPAERIGPNHLWNYFQPYFVFSIINLFFPSAIFFSLVALTRNVKVIYSASIMLFIAYLLANFLVRDLEKRELVKLLDPFALNTYSLETRFFTPAEKNTIILPITKPVLYNRLIWLTVSIVITVFCYFKFSFEKFLQPEKIKERKKKKLQEEPAIPSAVPHVKTIFNSGYARRIWWNLAKIEFLNVIRDNYFRAILLGGLIFLVLDFWIGDTLYSVPNRPLTIFLMDYKSYDYTVFIFIILLFYTGEAVHREKSTGFNVINDALPVSNSVFYLSKIAGIAGIAFVLSIVPMIVGIIIQTLKGYTHYELNIYLVEMLLLTLPGFIEMILLSFAVHTIVNNKFAAHGITMLIWIVMYLLRGFAHMDYNLFFYFYTPQYMWSDMNGLGHFAQPQFWFNFYWLCCGLMLAMIAFLFYQRGVAGGFRSKWQLARQQYKKSNGWLVWLFLAGWLASGAYIYYNVSYENTYVSFKDNEKRQVAYEKTLKRYENIPQPKVTSVAMKADIFPMQRSVHIYAKIILKNKTNTPIDSLHLLAEQNVKYQILYNGQALHYRSPLLFQRTAFTFFKDGDTANYRIYTLPQTLQPGDSAVMEVYSSISNKGFINNGFSREIVYNGTFYSGGLPSIGYEQGREMESDEKRKKYGLPEKKDDLPDYTDERARNTLLFNDDADLIHFEAIVSTDSSQTAIAPGYLQKTWVENGRRYFYYVQDTPIQYFFNIVSARYETLKDKVNLTDGKPVATQVFYHDEHPYNTHRFNDAFKDGLVYFSGAYGDFQFRQMRLLEFPRYASFAQSFPNTVPYSENFGWVADFSDPNSFDYGYFVTAHELAHQWWGHQIAPNATRGSNLISEALAEYSALILTARKYGNDNMKRFLKQELDNYLSGRANESKKENTFINCNRAYEWYYKGSLILYGLRDLIGDTAVTKALHEFRDSFALKENPPFPGSHDLYAFFQKHTPDSLKYYLTDTWEKITLYDNKFIKATSKKTGKDEYDITLQFSANKFYADSTGKESNAAMNDYIDVGVFAAETTDSSGRTKTNPLYLQKYKLTNGEHTITVHVKGIPVKAGIDPYNKLIDRIPDDNTGAVE